MQKLALIASLSAALAATLPAVAAALPDAAEQARIDADFWESMGRADRAQLALNKLLLTQPDDIRLLFEIGQLNLRLNQLDAAADTLVLMQQQRPEAAETLELQRAYDSASRDRLKLAGIRRLIEIGRHQQAVDELQTLFPDGAPDGDLGVSYYRVLFEHPDHRQAAREGLAELAARWPEQSRYRMALADLLTRDRATRQQGLQMLEGIASSRDTPSPSLLDLWRRSLLRGPADAASLESARHYLAMTETDAADDPELQDWQLQRSPPASTASTVAVIGRPAATRQTAEPARSPAVEPAAPSPADRLETLRLQADALQRRADIEDGRQRGGAALALLEQAQALVPDDPWLRFRLARRYLAIGVPDEARALMAEGLAGGGRTAAADAELRFASGLILESLDDPDAVLAMLAPIAKVRRSSDMRALASRARGAQTRRALDRLIAAGDSQAAITLLRKASAGPLEDPESVRSLAAAWRRLGQPADGIALLDRHPPLNPEQRVLRAELLDDLAASGAAQAGAADNRLGQLLPSLASDAELEAGQRGRIATVDSRRALRRIDQLFAAGKRDEGFRALDAALAARPRDLALRDERAGRLLAARRYGPAIADLRAVASGSDESWRAGRARDRLADLQARSDGFIAVGPSLRQRPGPAGLSRFSNVEIPVQLRLPLGIDRALIAHVDRVQASAGRLPADYDQAALFGQVQAQGPAALASFPDGDRQAISGVALALGWQSETLRADLGSTPIGFPVVDLVGGLRWNDTIGDYSLSADLARRPLTNSVLAYGGARDPVTGDTWGGARNQRLKLRAAQYGARLSYSASLEAGVITGRALPANRQLQLGAGVDWKFVGTPTQKLFIGVDGRYWQYQRNLGEYSYGHGGYYSPQLYGAIGVPLEWQGRLGRFSYRLRGALALSYAEVDAAPFYPGRPDLQAQAQTSPLPAGFQAPVYGANRGPGFGRSISGAAEYALSPRWSLGGSFDIDRAAFYAPNFFSLYLRHSLPQPLLRALPPKPPEPYSGY